MLKARINQLQKEIKDNLRIESQASWEKFCNDISLETNHTGSWCKIKNFLKPKGQHDYPALRLDAKTTKTNADKAQLFAESVERHFGIQSDNFDPKHFDEVNQFIEDNYEYFYPPEDPDDYRTDMDDDHDLVTNIDSDTLIRIVKFLKRGKAPGPDNIHGEVLKGGFPVMADITGILAANICRQLFFVITTTASTRCLFDNFQLICYSQRVNAKSQYNDSGNSRCSKWPNDRMVAVVKHCWLLVQGGREAAEKDDYWIGIQQNIGMFSKS